MMRAEEDVSHVRSSPCSLHDAAAVGDVAGNALVLYAEHDGSLWEGAIMDEAPIAQDQPGLQEAHGWCGMDPDEGRCCLHRKGDVASALEARLGRILLRLGSEMGLVQEQLDIIFQRRVYSGWKVEPCAGSQRTVMRWPPRHGASFAMH